MNYREHFKTGPSSSNGEKCNNFNAKAQTNQLHPWHIYYLNGI